ncbi:MAG: OsmC family protein [Gammaproteobacteria bacterium]|nr:OsmC family protein [Gammaproteobacteria bacterium]
MQKLPHIYKVAAESSPEANVTLSSPGLEPIASAGPAEFGGPGDLWSPETLLVAAVADCFILTFKAIARASKLDWASLTCDVDGKLDRVEKVSRFTELNLRVVLQVPPGTDEKRCMLLLEKSEHVCLITNSMTSENHLDAEVRIQ